MLDKIERELKRAWHVGDLTPSIVMEIINKNCVPITIGGSKEHVGLVDKDTAKVISKQLGVWNGSVSATVTRNGETC